MNYKKKSFRSPNLMDAYRVSSEVARTLNMNYDKLTSST
jgi:hypothetical protein